MGGIASLAAGDGTITATGSVGGEQMGLAVAVFAPPIEGPAAPTNVVATGKTNKVALSWKDGSGGAATGYIVLRSTTSGSGYISLATTTGNASTNYTDTNAIGGTTYYYVVLAVNASGPGPYSSEVSATAIVGPLPPSAPTILPPYRDATGTNVVIRAVTQSGYNYSLLSTTNLTPPAVWTTNSVTAGTGGTITNLAPISKSQRATYFKYLAQQ